ncbi:MAG TPA: FAD-dependent monooxygenase [Devosiaceae bacterium]
MSIHTHDVIIVGGGPVGLTLAASLTRFVPGIGVAVIDRRAFAVPSDGRASALAAGVTRVFEALDLWPGLAEAANPIRHMRITDSGRGDISRPLFLSFDGEVAPGRPFAHMVPNTATIGGLLGALGDADLIAPTSVKTLERGRSAAVVTLEDGRRLSAPLVVAADGVRSQLREMAGIGVITHDYGQTGIVTTIGHELEHDDTAYEHFRPAGPFASLPLPGQRSSLVWAEDPSAARDYSAMDMEAVALAIEAVMGSSLGKVTLEAPVQLYPLRMQLARDFVADRLALIGDAAHVVHPVAGQGMNLGLKDVAALAEVVVEALRLGQDPGGADVLERYQRWRRFDTALMAMVTDTMTRLFSNDVAPLRAVRDLGLGVVDRLTPVKAAMIRQAAGIGGSTPKLLRGSGL